MVNKVEIWKNISEVKGYSISNLGRVRSDSRLLILDNGKKIKIKERILIPWETNSGYLRVTLSDNKRKVNVYIHKLVAKYFIDNLYNYNNINHLDENKKNNCFDNLEWCTSKNNTIFSLHKRKVNFHPVPVDKYDINNNFICSYNSITEAAKSEKTSTKNIRYCLLGRNKLSAGYIWRFHNNK